MSLRRAGEHSVWEGRGSSASEGAIVVEEEEVGEGSDGAGGDTSYIDKE